MKWYGYIALLFVLPASLLANTLCSGTRYQASTMKRIMTRGTIRIGTITDNPPFYSKSHGLLKGFDYRVMKDIAKRLAVKLEIVPFARSSGTEKLLDAVEQGQVDMAMANITINPVDAKKVYFSQPYIKEDSILVVNRKRMHKLNWGQSLNYFLDKAIKMATINGFQEKQSAALYQHAVLLDFEGYSQALHAVAKGGADAMHIELQRAMYLLARQPALTNKLAIIKGKEYADVGFAVGYNSLYLHQWLDFYIRVGKASKLGFLYQMNKKYFYLEE